MCHKIINQITCNTGGGHLGAQEVIVAMVLCTAIECYKRSDHDKDVSFYRIPAVINHIGGEHEWELSERRRDGFLESLLLFQGKTLIKTMLALYIGKTGCPVRQIKPRLVTTVAR